MSRFNPGNPLAHSLRPVKSDNQGEPAKPRKVVALKSPASKKSCKSCDDTFFTKEFPAKPRKPRGRPRKVALPLEIEKPCDNSFFTKLVRAGDRMLKAVDDFICSQRLGNYLLVLALLGIASLSFYNLLLWTFQ